MTTESNKEQTRRQAKDDGLSAKGTVFAVDPNDPHKTASAVLEWVHRVSGRVVDVVQTSEDNVSSTSPGQDAPDKPKSATAPHVRTDLPVINIGEGELNADWIKHVDGGRNQRNEFRIHEQLLIKHYESEGQVEKANEARKRLEALGPWEYGEGERQDE